jgi:hypothetical protein
MQTPTLIFVYNADSGRINALLDMGHKIISPSTYSCSLCALTHSTFRMKDEWKQFVQGLSLPVEFLHRDELLARHGPRDDKLPAVFLKTNGGLQSLLASHEIEACATLGELRARLVERLPKK